MAENASRASSHYIERKPKWNNIWEFMFSCLSMSVGLGNFWRFPYVAYENGGGAFVIPYLIVLLLVGRPMYYLDLSMGQFSGRGSIGLYRCLAPAWIGIGISQAICCFVVFTYYAFLLCLVLIYLAYSFTTNLPWQICEKKWGNNCVSQNYSNFKNNKDMISSAELFLEKNILNKADSIENGLGWPSWKLCLCLLAVYICCFLYIIFGIRSSGKVAYFTGTFPYLIIIILLVRSSTLPGAVDGIIFFLKPDWKKLTAPSVWLGAMTQCFFSLGIGTGTVAMFASYNEFHGNIKMIALVIAITDTCTSFLSAFTIFSALGNLAKRMDVTVDRVIHGGGMYLAFVSYADAIAKFETVPYVFSVIFFFMFLVLGLGSLCSFQQAVTTNMLELIPNMKEWHVSAITSIIGFICSIIYTTPGGYAVFYLVDLFGNVYVLLALTTMQIIAVCYVYKLKNWCWDIEFMSKSKVNQYWRITWALISLIVLVFTYINAVFQEGLPKYNNKPLPLTAIISSFILLFLVSSPVFIAIFYHIIKSKRKGFNCKEACKDAFSSENWLPLKDISRNDLIEFREMKADTYRYKDNSQCKQYLMSLFKKD